MPFADERKLLPLVAAIVSGGFVPLATLPFVVVGLTSGLNLDATGAGFLGTVELGGATLGSLAVAPLLRYASRMHLAVIAMAVGVALEIVSCFLHSVAFLCAVRVFVGLACGVALGAGNAIVATVADPSRFYMRVLAWESAVTTIVWALMPMCLKIGAQVGVFSGAAITLIVLLGVALLTRSADDFVARGTDSSQGVAVIPINRLNAAIALVAVLLCCVRDGLAWTFADQIGSDLGLSSAQQTVLWAAIGFFGLVGLLASARLLGTRQIVLGVVASAALASAVTTGILFTTSTTAYVLYALPWTTFEFVAVSFLTGLAAQIDRSGRIAAASGGFFLLGYAIAPFLAGVIITHFGQHSVAELSIACSLLTIGTGYWVARRILGQQAGETAAMQQAVASK